LRILEAYLGAALVSKEPKGIHLTALGLAYHSATRVNLKAIATNTQRLRLTASGRQRVVVSSVPSFALKWLAPRIAQFHSQHPSIEVQLDANRSLVDLTRDDVDLAVRQGNGQ
jgi:LysR family transcriptional regulator, glycine cleavage system transcriptional activator